MSESTEISRTKKEQAPFWTDENIKRAAEMSIRTEDSYGFAYESLADFSDAPLEFEEYAFALMEDFDDIYYFTGTFNRFSPNYIRECEQMEKVIRLLGSCCVTKAVLEQKGFTFKKLDQLRIDLLYRCVSFNFRKCHAAVKEGREKHILDERLLGLECRLFLLAERLRATAEKIEKIRSGKISADAMLERSTVFNPKPGRAERKTHMFGTYPVGVSMPVMGSVARQMIRDRKEKEKPKHTGSIPGVSTYKSQEIHPPIKIPGMDMPGDKAAPVEKKMPKTEADIHKEKAEKEAFDREIELSTAEFLKKRLGITVPVSETAAKPQPEQGERKPLSYHPVMKKKKPKKKKR